MTTYIDRDVRFTEERRLVRRRRPALAEERDVLKAQVRGHKEEDAHRVLETEGPLCERVDHKNDQDDGEEDAVDIDVGER